MSYHSCRNGSSVVASNSGQIISEREKDPKIPKHLKKGEKNKE
jgi:hypothetical protein